MNTEICVLVMASSDLGSSVFNPYSILRQKHQEGMNTGHSNPAYLAIHSVSISPWCAESGFTEPRCDRSSVKIDADMKGVHYDVAALCSS